MYLPVLCTVIQYIFPIGMSIRMAGYIMKTLSSTEPRTNRVGCKNMIGNSFGPKHEKVYAIQGKERGPFKAMK